MDLNLRQDGKGSNRLWADGMGPESRDWVFVTGAAETIIQNWEGLFWKRSAELSLHND